MSDSEDDFMSDKFLVDVVPEEKTTYTARRSRAQLEGLRKSQAHNARMLPLKQREEEQRRAGLSKSLFDDDDDEDTAPRGGIGSSSAAARKDPPKKDAGQAKAMDFMRKMGWTPGEGLGRRRSASPERRPRKEPIRISMWAGRKGLTARSPSPPPLPKRLGPDDIAPTAQARLEREAGEFRGRRGADFTLRDIERKEAKAREILVELDEKKGIKFHPLHAQPRDPEALPRPLFIRLYPEMDTTRSRSASPELTGNVLAPPASSAPSATAIAASARNLSAAEKLREQMRRDMLADLGGEDEELVRFGIKIPDEKKTEAEGRKSEMEDKPGEEPDWDEMVSGTKRVLAMTPEEHLAFLISQLRHEHLFCFWCGSKYSSWDEMEGPGGCPGEDEDDH